MHKHEYKPKYDRVDTTTDYQCDCGEWLFNGSKEIVRRLNATECLSAEDADKAASFMTQWAWIQTAIPHDEERISALCAYAKALEDEDA